MALATSPDVVLMDLEMPELNGMDATRALREAGSDARVVVLTTFSDRDRILGALDAGALGYLLKDAEPEEIIRGVRAAARGESPLAPRAAHELLIERAGGQARPEAELSAREQEVLALVAEGLPNKLIARRLRDLREDGQGASHQRVRGDRGHRSHAGGAVGSPAQARPVAHHLSPQRRRAHVRRPGQRSPPWSSLRSLSWRSLSWRSPRSRSGRSRCCSAPPR